MPTKKSDGTLFLSTSDGQMLEFHDISESVIDIPETNTKMCDVTLIPDKTVEFTGTFKLGKHFRCKSRKRFVKLLMSKGIQRNVAVAIALIYRYIFKVSYQSAWLYFSI